MVEKEAGSLSIQWDSPRSPAASSGRGLCTAPSVLQQCFSSAPGCSPMRDKSSWSLSGAQRGGSGLRLFQPLHALADGTKLASTPAACPDPMPLLLFPPAQRGLFPAMLTDLTEELELLQECLNDGHWRATSPPSPAESEEAGSPLSPSR